MEDRKHESLTPSEYMDTLVPEPGVPAETWKDAQGVTFERVEIVEGYPETAVDMPVCRNCGNGPLDEGRMICGECCPPDCEECRW